MYNMIFNYNNFFLVITQQKILMNYSLILIGLLELYKNMHQSKKKKFNIIF